MTKSLCCCHVFLIMVPGNQEDYAVGGGDDMGGVGKGFALLRDKAALIRCETARDRGWVIRFFEV